MKFLSGILLSMALATSASAAIIDRSLGDILSNAATQTDTGGQAINFTDFASQGDNSTFNLRLESAGDFNINTMGLYLYNTSTELQATGPLSGLFEIFSGTQSVGDFTDLSFDFTTNLITKRTGLAASPELDPTVTTFGGLGSTANYTSALYSSLATINLANLEIGVYLKNNTGTFYSHDDLNAGGKRMVGIFEIESTNGLAFAWEDRISGDNDYNDMVVFANDVSLVPEPTTLAIFGLGLLALARVSRRKA